MQEEEKPKERQETGSLGTESRVASDFQSKPGDPARKDKGKKSEWVCINFISDKE